MEEQISAKRKPPAAPDSPAKRVRTETDLLVRAPVHPLAEPHDDELDAEGSAVDTDDEDFMDPALKRVRAEENAFAANTGQFITPEQAGLPETAPYTTLHQALADQPLATNPSQQTITLIANLDHAITEPASNDTQRLDRFMESVKQQLYQISQRVDSLETNRFSSNHSITTLQSSIAQLETKFRFPSSVDADTSHQILQALNAHDHHQTDSSTNGVSEAANVSSAHQLKDLIQSQMVEMSNGAVTDEYKALHNSLTALNPFNILGSHSAAPTASAPTSALPISNSKSTAPSTTTTTKRTKKSPATATDLEIDPELTVKQEAPKPKKKARKPELSRVVRATMFKMLGISVASKYHGYTSSPELPAFTPTLSFDPESGMRIWRWEWDKTIRQSTHNAAFASAINQSITAERAAGGVYGDVPEKDWDALDDAIDSAFTNLRRERDSQVDPTKKAKKDEHRRRNKKRGLKEEKCRRRVKAHTETKKIKDEEASAAMGGKLDGIESSFGAMEEDENDISQSLELRYMSSEEELDMSDPATLTLSYGDPLSDSPAVLVAGEKTFATYRPSWRSPAVVAAFGHLDSLRPPERSYKRVIGVPREELPPLDTPAWMMNEESRVKLEEKKAALQDAIKRKPVKSARGGKGKGKAVVQD